ncbi:MAG: FAD:protein FMN transferase [Rhodobacteraceae bacterium]|nr:FAD:protein FMN transferase [Paracoccaceae bacterium]
MNRRRFLTIAAAALAAPAFAAPAQAAEAAIWTGRALGSDARIILHGAGPHQARSVFRRVERELTRIEGHFSLHAESALTRLNRDGCLPHPTPEITAVFALAGRVHSATGGVFDPTIQPLWLALATGEDAEAARRHIGWHRVRATDAEIRLDPGMALTFNGIAQGHAADRIATLLRDQGFGNVLIDMGEVMALGLAGSRPWTAAIADPDGRELARTALSDRALATSSPRGTLIGAEAAHILHPSGRPPLWSTLAVSAPDAATADALSTAFCLMDRAAIDAALTAFPDAKVEVLI